MRITKIGRVLASGRLNAIWLLAVGLSAMAIETISAQPNVIDGGEHHVVAVHADGTVWAWGDNEYGQLGDGAACDATVDRIYPGPVLKVGGAPLGDGIYVAAGNLQSAAIDTLGQVWTWGRNDAGQLGDGQPLGIAPCRSLAARVVDATGAVLENVTAVDSGFKHMVAVRADGTVWSWGVGDHGQLGDGIGADRSEAAQVVDCSFQPLTGIVEVAAGRRFSLALGADGSMWSWGYDEHGQLGDDGSVSTYSFCAVPVRRLGNQPLVDVQRIAAGRDFSLAVDRAGTLWAWGSNDDGQLGDGSRDDSLQARQVELPSISNPSHLAAGTNHTFLLTLEGNGWAWGSNSSAELGGYPEREPFFSTVPLPILGADGAALNGLRAITASHDAGFALDGDTQVLSWGDDRGDQLGRPTEPGQGSDHRPLPVLRSDGTPFTLDTPQPPPVVTLIKQGSGDGTVSGTVSGEATDLDCAPGCEQVSIETSRGVLLRLDAVDAPGSDFFGFSGSGCEGTVCELLMEHDVVIRARFEIEPPLSIVATVPEDGRVGVDPEQNLFLTFNREVELGPELDQIELRRMADGELWPVTAGVDGEDRVEIDPNEPLDLATEYELTWPSHGAVDDEGAGLEAPFSLRFTIRPEGSTRLTLGFLHETMVEGASQPAWVWLDQEADRDHIVQLFTEPAGALDMPAQVIIAEGEIGASFNITSNPTEADQTILLHAAELDSGRTTRELRVADTQAESGSGFEFRGCHLSEQVNNAGNHDQHLDAGETWDLGWDLVNDTGGGLESVRLCLAAVDFPAHLLLKPTYCPAIDNLTASTFTLLHQIRFEQTIPTGTYHLRVDATTATGPGFVGYCALPVVNREPVDYTWSRVSNPGDRFDAGETVRVAYEVPHDLENGQGEPPPRVRFWLEDELGGLVWERSSWADSWTLHWSYFLEFQVPEELGDYILRSEINPLPDALPEERRSNNDAAEFRFKSRRPNNPPEPRPISGPSSIEVEQELRVEVPFYDEDGDTLEFRLLQGPAGASVDQLDSERALVRWTPPVTVGPDPSVAFEIEAYDGFRGWATSSFTVQVTYVADLGITITGAEAVRGQPVEVEVRVWNGSPSPVAGVGVLSTLAAALGNPSWTCADVNGTCTAAGNGDLQDVVSLPGFGEVIYTLTGEVEADSPDLLEVSTWLSHPPPSYSDPNPANDEGALTLTVVEPGADLRLAAAIASTRILPGRRTRFTMLLSNEGNVTAEAVELTLLWPLELQDPSLPACDIDPPTSGVPCRLGDLVPGESIELVADWTVDSATPPGLLSIEAAVTSGTHELSPGDETVSLEIHVADLTGLIFQDGFEKGNTCGWSVAEGGATECD